MLRKALASTLYSPVRLTLAAVTAGCLLIGSLLVLDVGSQPHRAAGSAHTEHQGAPTQPDAADTSQAPGGSESRQPADRRVSMRALKRFLGGYLIGAKQGRYPSPELQRVTTPALWRGLKVADRSAIPHGRVENIQQGMSGAYAAEYIVNLVSGHGFVVDLVLTPAGWRVCDIEPQRGS